MEQAVAALATGNHAAAERLCRAVLEAAPRDPAALHIAAHARRGQGDGAGAREFLRRALESDPHNLQAMEELGAAELEAGEFQQSESWLRRAIGLGRRGAAVSCWLGLTLSAQGRHAEAVEAFRQATAADPRNPGMPLNLGHELAKTGLKEDAIASYDRVLALEPGHVEAHCNRGAVLLELGRFQEALASYERALALDPDNTDALNNRGIALLDLNRHEEAARAYQRLLEAAPDYPCAAGFRLHMLLQCCEWNEYEKYVAQVEEGIRAARWVSAPFNFLVVSDSAADQLQCSRLFMANDFPPVAPPVWKGERYRHERVRVAYLSADFHDHATAQLIAGLIEAHDRKRFETTAVSFGPRRSDVMRARLTEAFERFVEVGHLSDREVALMLRDLEIDIAVDLKAYTKDCRPGILAHRGAPVQVNFLGYPGTMGAPYMDYIIGDRTVIPPEHRACYTESVVYLPDCYQVNDSKRGIATRTPARSELGLPEQGFVFCCFNNNYKITPRVFAVWMRLLSKVEGGVLWLLETNETAARNLRREAERRGVAPDRLIFAPRVRLDEHLARHRLADLFLDTLPYNAHTTASDALWAGLPVLTHRGHAFAGRVAASLLEAVGVPELITHSWQEYEGLALKLGGDRDLLASIKAKLARNRATSPLFDTDRYRRHLEAAYITMWERAQRGEPAAPFSVPVG
ncbi:MAG: tetratricopeptide repeat protein [Burkholderiales bacterium]